MAFNSIENTLFIGKVLHYLDITDSTNEYAKLLLANSKPIHGTVILSYNQTRGRGQYGRIWENVSKGSMAYSLLLKDRNTPVRNQYILNKAIALGTVNCISRLLPDESDAKIKWPNDIMVNDRKIAGILIENNFRGEIISSSIVGIGINIGQNEFPENLPYATSLRLSGDFCSEPDKVVEVLSLELEKCLIAFYKGQFKKINDGYEQKIWKLGEGANFTSEEGTNFSAIIRGVDEEGRIELEQAGKIKVYTHGVIRVKM